METKNKISTVLTIAVFCLTVLLLAALSLYKLGDYYLNDAIDYNEWKPELGSRFEQLLCAVN